MNLKLPLSFQLKNICFAIAITISTMSHANDAQKQFNQAEIFLKQNNHSKAFNLLKSAAKAGHVPAQAELARQYMDEEADYFDYSKSMEWAKKAAAQNNPSGMNTIGYLYDHGFGVEENNEEAMKWFVKAANLGFSKSQYNIGRMNLEGEDIPRNLKKGIEWITLGAENGYLDAQLELANAYHLGCIEGVEINAKKAIYWYEQALKQNDTEAIYQLGRIYQDGLKEVEPNVEKAINYLTKAAKQNHSYALNSLGVIYHDGMQTIQPDINKAMYYYKQAAIQDNENAYYNLGLIYEKINETKNAIEMYKKAGELGSNKGYFNVAELYLNNDQFNNNKKEAFKYYKLAAEEGHDGAQLQLADMYKNGISTKADPKQAKYWQEMSAENFEM